MRPAPAQQSQQPLTASPAAELEDGAAAPLLSAYPDQRPDARRQREIQALASQHPARFPGALPAVQFRLAGSGGGEDAAEPAPVIQHSSYSPIQRQVASASAQSVADMSLDEKWGIVYENAIQGAGSGMVMAMMMILGLILLLGAVVAAVAFLAPEFAAAWAAVLAETTILGASLGTWITATLTALGLSASLTAIVNEFRTVNTAINNAQTVGDLQSAGRDWGYNTAEAIAEIMVIVLTHASVRSVVERLERDIARRFRGRSGSGVGSVAAEAATSATEVAAVGEVEIAAEVAAAGETVTGATEVAAVEELAAGAEDVAAALPVRRPPLWWGRWNDYSHATIYGEEYAVINGRFYTRHAVDRMQPSGYSWSRHVSPDVTGPRRGTGGQGQIRRAGGDYGRSVAPRYVEEVIATGTRTPNPPLPGRRIRPGEQRTSYSCGSVEVITESYNNDPAAIVITIETH